MVRVETSPQLFARIGGALYLLVIGLGAYLQVVLGEVVVSNDAAATSIHLASMESMWRIGITCEFVAICCVTALAMIYFVLLRPISRELNLLATFFRLVGLAIEAFATLSLSAALFPLAGANYLKAFTPAQLQALSYLALKAHAHGYALALLFFGFCFLAHGQLIATSRYLPRLLGVLIQVAGVAYTINSVSLFVAPAFEARIFPLILLPAFVGETSLCLWLLVKGVNVDKWRLAHSGPALSCP
jgi:hypothetical protein